jgi:hypothetical protein
MTTLPRTCTTDATTTRLAAMGFPTASSRVVAMAALAALALLTRVPYVSDAPLMSKDGPLYITSLALDANYCVPMPGNLGFVLLARGLHGLGLSPIAAFAAVNLLLTTAAAGYVFLIGARWLPASLAFATSVAMLLNPMVWWHGATINSYLVWLAVLPAIAYHGLRFHETRRTSQLVAMSLALGVGTALRQDLVAFGTPLWLAAMLLGRASWRQWALAVGLIALCCAGWFGGMSVIFGGPEAYLARVQAKHNGHMEGFSVEHRGLFEGLVRNASKFALFLVWAAPLVLVPALYWIVAGARSWSLRARAVLGALLWAGPAMAFTLFVFAGNAGLVFPVLPLLYLAAAGGLWSWLRHEGDAYATAAMLALGLAGASQFVAAPLLPETNQRNVILNVTLLRYSGPGLIHRFDRNLDDYGIDPALRNVLEQLRHPQPIPGRVAALPPVLLESQP